MDQDIIRENIRLLLHGEQAHMTLQEAVKDFPEEKINTIFPNGTYSSWHLLEHIRITQHDILDFMINPHYKEPEWPKDYWPAPDIKANQKTWNKSINEFLTDLKKLEALVMDKKLTITSKVPQGTTQTYIREFLLVADHNAYHIGEFAIMRQTLDTWKK